MPGGRGSACTVQLHPQEPEFRRKECSKTKRARPKCLQKVTWHRSRVWRGSLQTAGTEAPVLYIRRFVGCGLTPSGTGHRPRRKPRGAKAFTLTNCSRCQGFPSLRSKKAQGPIKTLCHLTAEFPSTRASAWLAASGSPLGALLPHPSTERMVLQEASCNHCQLGSHSNTQAKARVTGNYSRQRMPRWPTSCTAR